MKEILDDFEFKANAEKQYVLAGKGKRFLNYVIDTIAYLLFSAIIGFIFGVLSTIAIGTDFLLQNASPELQAIVDLLVSLIMITFFYTIQEYVLKGKTLGKIITKTRAVTDQFQRISFGEALKRSLCRFIPFEAFSFLGEESRGWHDSIPKTKVIEDHNWRG